MFLKIKIKLAYKISVLVFILSVGYYTANASILSLNSGSVSFSVGEIATLSVVLNSEGVAVNNAEATINFPSDLLEVVSVNKNNSIFSLWVEEPSFSNLAGTVTFNGGLPTPGFVGSSGQILSIIVKAKNTGKANFIFSNAAVRANDGLGTNVLSAKIDKTINIIKKEIPIATEPVLPGPSLVVSSLTHPNQDLWYKDINPTYKWVVSKNIKSIQTGIDDNTSGAPRVTYTPAISEKTVKDLKDGVWYFKVRARNETTWGPISTYIVRLDTKDPQKNSVEFNYNDDKKILSIKADIVDETSGLDYYEIYINDVLFKKVSSIEFINGNYDLEYKTPGNNIVKLIAIDRAGNSVESSSPFYTSAIIDYSPELVTDKEVKQPLLITVGSTSAPAIYIFVIVVLVTIILLLVSFNFGCRYGRNNHKIIKRRMLFNGGNIKTLLVMKRRLEKHLEILQRTRHIRILSKEEKDIKQSIEIDLDEIDRAIEEQNQV